MRWRWWLRWFLPRVLYFTAVGLFFMVVYVTFLTGCYATGGATCAWTRSTATLTYLGAYVLGFSVFAALVLWFLREEGDDVERPREACEL